MTAPPQESPQELVLRLRRRFGLSEDVATDQQVLDATKGTFGRAMIELDMASDRLGGVLRDDIRETRQRLHARIHRFLGR